MSNKPGSVGSDDHGSSFPTGLTVPGGGQAMSVISSAVSDPPEAEGEGGPQGVTGPAGEPGIPPSRPSTAATAKTGTTAKKAPGSTAESRPPSSYSRTHVPSLTSSAFFRPMSSQRLQAQRGQRPLSNLGPRSVPSNDSKENRAPGTAASQMTTSTAAAQTAAVGLRYDERPVSRATDITDMPDRGTANASPSGADTLRSAGESEAPLSGADYSPRRHIPANLDLTRPFKSNTSNQPPQKSPRSPISFRSSFIIPNRNSRASIARRQEGHEKLESDPPTPHTLTREETKEQVRRELGKNYEYFAGNTRFFWGGRVQNAREVPINVATGLAILVPAVLFFVFSAHDLWHLVSPAIPIVFAYIFLICFSSFIHASLSNPGILPRNLHPFPPANPNEDPLTIGPALTDWTMVVSATSANAAMEVPTKYCKTCNIWRPPRTHHCRTCDNCIETQDHHCVWLNNCVGRRNYRQFFTFVFSGTILAGLLVGFSIWHILAWQSHYGGSFVKAVRKTRGVPLAMVIYGAIAGAYPLALTMYHLGLMGSAQTTREYLQSRRFLKKDRHRPFTQGNFVKNWIVMLNRPRPPTYLHFKKRYEEGDQRYGERRRKRTAALAPEQQNGGMEMQNMAQEG